MRMQSTIILNNDVDVQSVQIPEEFRIETDEVWIEKIGNSLVITPMPSSWDDFFESPFTLSEDFEMERT